MIIQSDEIAQEVIREARTNAANRRLSRDMASLHRWQRISRFSARRAARSRRRLAERPGA